MVSPSPWAHGLCRVDFVCLLRALRGPAGQRPGCGSREPLQPHLTGGWGEGPQHRRGVWGSAVCPCPHQARQVLAAPLLCLAKEQKRGSRPGHA